MTLFDYAVLMVIVLSVLIGYFRGAVGEVLSLLAWIVALWLAKQYATKIAQFLPESIPTESLRLLAAFTILFVLTLIVMTLFRIAVSALVKFVGLQALNRGLGVLFGIARGIVVVIAGVLAAGMTSVPKTQTWQAAVFSPPLEHVAINIKPWLPQGLANRINYN